MIDVRAEHLKLIKEILSHHIPNYEVRAFGSRVSGGSRPYSDLDLALVGKEQISQKLYYQLKNIFEESTLPFRVDLLDWHRISDDFRQIIEQEFQIIQKGG